MEKAFDYIKELIIGRFGASGFLVLVLVLVLIYAWYQHQRVKLLKERIDIGLAKKDEMAGQLSNACKATEQVGLSPPKSFGSNTTVLIVDDEASMLDLLGIVITRACGFTVLKSGDGVDALEKIREKKPDLLILDLLMPRMTGFDVIRELTKDNISLPIIVISGHIRAVSKEVANELKGLTFIEKPFESSEILAAVTEKLKRKE
jgi:CheY-like chemotaxis protein